jgi:hypothetical protein
VPYQPLQDKCQNALKVCWLARVKKCQFHGQGHSCTLLFPCVNLRVILSQAGCQTVTAYIFCTVWYRMVPGLHVATASAGWHVEKVTYVHNLVQIYKYFNRITAVTTETVPAWQLAARNLVLYKEQIMIKITCWVSLFLQKMRCCYKFHISCCR